MIILRSKEFSIFGSLFKKKEATIDPAEKERKELNDMIEERFSWAIDYNVQLSDKIKEANKKLDSFGYIVYDGWEIETISNLTGNLSEYVMNFQISYDTNLNPLKNRCIKYNKDLDCLCLYEGKPDQNNSRVIEKIKNIQDLRRVVRKYYFDEILKRNYLKSFNAWVKYESNREVWMEAELKETDFGVKPFYQELIKQLKTLN
jgi:hypothetical protein